MNHDQQLNTRITDALQQRADGLDGATLSRLRQARAHAVEQGSRRRHHWLTIWLPTAGVLAAATLVAVNVWYVQPQDLAAPDPALLEHLALDSSPAPIEEPEFYEWLARNHDGAA
jgi:type VI protein secretion system component VasF